MSSIIRRLSSAPPRVLKPAGEPARSGPSLASRNAENPAGEGQPPDVFVQRASRNAENPAGEGQPPPPSWPMLRNGRRRLLRVARRGGVFCINGLGLVLGVAAGLVAAAYKPWAARREFNAIMAQRPRIP